MLASYPKTQRLQAKQMKIPPNARVLLAELMLENIDHADEGLRGIWLSEVKKRMQSVKEGKSKLLDFEALC